MNLVERMLRHTRPEGDCVVWTGAVMYPTGRKEGSSYGILRTGTKSVRVHRVAYEAAVGPIPTGITIDHLCRNTRCVHPFHLEAVTPKENTLRGVGPSAVHARRVVCKRGHFLQPRGDRRRCPICDREAKRRYKARVKAANDKDRIGEW